ncbi:hypothetical protein D3C80_1132870 [compost metagenome]
MTAGGTFGLLARFFALQAAVAQFKATAGMIAFGAAGGQGLGVLGHATDNRDDVAGCAQWQQVDAIYRAGRHAQVAACAFSTDHGVHQFGCTNNGIHRAGLDAFGAANAFGFADIGDLGRRATALRVQGYDRHLQQAGQGGDGFVAAWRTFIDRFALGQALCIGLAARVTTFAALGLRQQGVDALNQTHDVNNPLKPRNAKAITPAPINSAGRPRKLSGIASLSLR